MQTNVVLPQTTSHASLLGFTESNKRSRTNKFDNTSSNTGSTSSPTDITVNTSKNNTLLDSAETGSNVMTNNNIVDLQNNESLSNFHSTTGTSTQSLLRIKEESSSTTNMDLNATNQSNGRLGKSRNSYLQQPEHVVIPADPSLMQGKLITS